MKQIKTVLVFVAILVGVTAKGQDNLVIDLADGDNVSVPVEDIRRVTFDEENMLLKYITGYDAPFELNAIELVTFEGEIAGKTTEMFIHSNGGVLYQTGLTVADSIKLTKVSVTVGQPVEINGVTWAASNVNAPGTLVANPWDFGMLYKWNIPVGWSSTDPLVNHEGGTTWDSSPAGGLVWEESNNVCPDGWHIATQDEFESLVASGYFLGELNGVAGYFFGNGENRVFMPITNYRRNQVGHYGELVLNNGRYWSSTTTDDQNGVSSYHLGLYLNTLEIGGFSNGAAMSIRCVMSE